MTLERKEEKVGGANGKKNEKIEAIGECSNIFCCHFAFRAEPCA